MSSPQDLLNDVARQHGFSPAAVQEAVTALRRSGGSIAQFGHPEFGGMGQWMPGMLMIGDMFNNQLKGRVDALFHELSRRLGEFDQPAASPGLPPLPGQVAAGGGGSSYSYGYGGGQSANWYPADLGVPASSGSQNDFRWAFFPSTRRLALQVGHDLSVYDTEDHSIGGVSQQQDSRGGHITLTSQRGHVDVARLRKVR
jgi:hypothetical protein